MTRLASTTGDLARRGFHDPDTAFRHLGELPPQASDFLDLFDRAPDPDLALMGVVSVAGTPEYAALADDREAVNRLVAVLGGSIALNHHLAQRPAHLAVFADVPERHEASAILARVLADIGAADPMAVASAPDATDRLRVANKRELCRIAARDLSSGDPFAAVDDIAAELADLADAIMVGALCIARAEVADHADARFAIVGLGKCGARELNYVSDVDVLFVAEPARDDVAAEHAARVATRLAAATTRICSAHTATGTIWQVDAGLRPEGNAGPLVRSLASMRSYYEKWASNWEFQAMLKARPMAGDADLGAAFVDLVAPLVWLAGERENFIAESQAMRKRVIALIPPKEAAREIKLSSGGLRDVEFSVQLLQLVHGRSDERLRLRATLPSLDALVSNGYIGRSDGAELASAYRLQRALEHRVQLQRLRRTHLMPDDDRGMRMLARGLGFRTSEELVDAWKASTRRVQRLHQRVFYSPLLEAVARIHTDELRLSPDAARTRLRALGFHDPAAALRHIGALTQGASRAVEIQRQLMPAMLGWFADGPNPDHGLLSFRQVSESLGATHWYLRALRDEGQMAEHLAHILSSSRYAVGLLQRAPETVQLLADDAECSVRTRDELTRSMMRAAERHESTEDAFASVRARRRKELLRLAIADLLHTCDEVAIGAGLADLAGATIDAALAIAARGDEGAPPVGVVAMGRWGGREMSHGSDADAMFVIPDSDDETAVKRATAVVARMRQLLAAPGPDPALEVDADLRPDGKFGPMVRSLSSCLAYYRSHSATWEAQALLRAGFGAGDVDTVGRLLVVADSIRYPSGGLTRTQIAEIRRLKARMETERMPRGSDPARNTKMGPGGLADVEWTVQLLQLQHGHDLPGLRTTSTLDALHAAQEAGLVTAPDAAALEAAWRLATRLRNAIMLVRARASDLIPGDAREAAAIAYLLGYEPASASLLVDEWRKAARRAGGVVGRLLWGED